MELLICTSNSHKIEEIQSYLGPKFSSYKSFLDLNNFNPPLENSLTFQGNALIKATAGYKASGLISLADDSGLEVLALNNRPGVFSARYAGEKATDSANNTKLLSELKDQNVKAARFVSALAIVGPQKTLVVTGTVYGTILNKPRGIHGFGYDPLFYIPELGKTMAELSLEEKNKISHRAKALEKLVSELSGFISL